MKFVDITDLEMLTTDDLLSMFKIICEDEKEAARKEGIDYGYNKGYREALLHVLDTLQKSNNK